MTQISHSNVLKSIENVDGWLTPHEALMLFESAKISNSKGEIVEIGSWKGRSTIALSLGIKSRGILNSVNAIDPHQGIINGKDTFDKPTFKKFVSNIKSAEVDKFVKPIIKTSKQAARSWSSPVSLLFIDGLHDYEHAKEDFLLWNKYVSDGGIIAFHDGFCGHAGVWEAVNKYFLKPNTLIGIGTVSSIIFGIKGKPSAIQKFRNIIKIGVMRVGMSIYKSNIMPSWFKLHFIHHILRVLLIHPITLSVYKN
jgi:hypothetical protein